MKPAFWTNFWQVKYVKLASALTVIIERRESIESLEKKQEEYAKTLGQLVGYANGVENALTDRQKIEL